MPAKFSTRPSTLKVTDFSYYLDKEVLLYYYQQINKADSLGSDVDSFYLNFLKEIFLLKDKFGIEQESTVTKKKTDFTIRYIKNGASTKVILCENERTDLDIQASMWKSTLAQVVDYARLVREEPDQSLEDTLYLTVNIGTHLRFYELPGNSLSPLDWAPAEGHVYELADDEEKVWELWHALRDLIMH